MKDQYDVLVNDERNIVHDKGSDTVMYNESVNWEVFMLMF